MNLRAGVRGERGLDYLKERNLRERSCLIIIEGHSASGCEREES